MGCISSTQPELQQRQVISQRQDYSIKSSNNNINSYSDIPNPIQKQERRIISSGYYMNGGRFGMRVPATYESNSTYQKRIEKINEWNVENYSKY